MFLKVFSSDLQAFPNVCAVRNVASGPLFTNIAFNDSSLLATLLASSPPLATPLGKGRSERFANTFAGNFVRCSRMLVTFSLTLSYSGFSDDLQAFSNICATLLKGAANRGESLKQ